MRNEVAFHLSYLPELLRGAAISVEVTLVATPLALLIGLMIALCRMSRIRMLKWPANLYVQVIRGTPLLLQLYYIYFVAPFVGITLSAYVAGIAGLAINYSAYMSEVYRAAFEAVDPTQREAGQALGLSNTFVLWRIIIPQTIRFLVPPLGNYFVGMFKDSAIVSVIGLNELLFTAQDLAKSSFQSLSIFTTAFAIYFAISFPAARLATWLERRLTRAYMGADREGITAMPREAGAEL